MMLVKSICRRCVNERQLDRSWGEWTQFDDEVWNGEHVVSVNGVLTSPRRMVLCPGPGMVCFVDCGEGPPSRCTHSVEHVVSQC